jgi:hypothetical protein
MTGHRINFLYTDQVLKGTVAQEAAPARLFGVKQFGFTLLHDDDGHLQTPLINQG